MSEQWKVYENPKGGCRICKDGDVFYIPIVRLENGDIQSFGVCKECKDLVPHEILPVKSVLGEGYFCCPYTPLDIEPVVLDKDDSRTAILTRYGKKLMNDQ